MAPTRMRDTGSSAGVPAGQTAGTAATCFARQLGPQDGSWGVDEERSGSPRATPRFLPVPPAGTGRKGRKRSRAFAQVEATYRLEA
jgi:hypothetical protein